MHWHEENSPIYSVSFQRKADDMTRLATAGGDNNVRIWNVMADRDASSTSVEYLLTLRKHTQAVNVVRFDPNGSCLMTAGDDGKVIFWTKSSTITQEFGHQDDDNRESWVAGKIYNAELEVYDACWSPDSSYVAIGSMDNTIRIIEAQSGNKVAQTLSHTHYVQGIAWDPLNEYIATQSADRTLQLHKLLFSEANVEVTTSAKFSRCEFPAAKRKSDGDGDKNTQARPKRSTLLYHSETLQSFFRRLAFSPDGLLLVTTLGVYRLGDKDEKNDEAESDSSVTNTVYIHIRSGFNKQPICHLPGLPKPAIAIAFSPIYYESLNPGVFKLPYKMVFAVATQNSVFVYDTESLNALGVVENLHYSTITDLSWEKDGQRIMISSADGFCSVIKFTLDIFGEPKSIGATLPGPNGSISAETSSSRSKDALIITQNTVAMHSGVERAMFGSQTPVQPLIGALLTYSRASLLKTAAAPEGHGAIMEGKVDLRDLTKKSDAITAVKRDSIADEELRKVEQDANSGNSSGKKARRIAPTLLS